MADDTQTPDPIESEVLSDDPQAARAASGFQTVINSAPVQQALNVGANLDAYQAMVNAAMAGDPDAQAALAQHNAGIAMGSLRTVNPPPVEGAIPRIQQAVTAPPTTAAAYLDKADAAAQLAQKVEEAGLSMDDLRTAMSAKNAQMDKMQRLAAQKKNPRGYAEGGEIAAPEETPDVNSVNVLNPDGDLVSIPGHQLKDALAQGYNQASPEDIANYTRHEKYGSTSEQLKTAAEGAAEAATFGLSTGAEQALGVNPEDIAGRREENPVSHAVGQGAGLLGSAFIPGVGEANLLEKAGAAGAKALGLEVPVTAVAKVGSAAAKSAIENMLFQSGDEVSKLLTQDPSVDPAAAASTAAANIGLSGLIGGAAGGALGSVSPLWDATFGAKTGGMLKTIANKLGGKEGDPLAGMTTVDAALHHTGLADSVPPEIRAAMSSDPQIRELASVLEQTDSNRSGQAYQVASNGFRQRVAEVQSEAFGKNLADVPAKGEIDKYGTGKNIGDTLAAEYNERVKPLAEAYDEFSNKFKGKELATSIEDKAADMAKAQDKAFGELQKAQRELGKALKAQDPGAAIEAEARVTDAQNSLRTAQAAAKAPGSIDGIAEKIAQRAQQEGWTASPSGDIMKEVSRVLKELPNLKTLKDLSNYIKQVGENTASKLPFGMQTPVSRAGGIIKSILREEEANLIGHHIGSEEGAAVLEKYEATRKAYAAAAKIRDAIDDRLGAGGSTSGYGKTIKAMAQQEGEKVLSRLSGAKDADWLATVSREFPRTAKMIKDYHINNLLAYAKDGESLSSAKLMKALDAMSPQLRDFTASPEVLGKVKSAHSLLESLNDSTHNWSNTARTVEKLMSGIPGTVVGTAGSLLGHDPISSFLLGSLTKTIGKDAPDAVRLALLKFLGSSEKVEPGAFKTAVDFIHHTIQGENRIQSGVKAIFNTSKEVIPSSLLPTESDRNKLDKALIKLQKDPSALTNVGGKVPHYLPEQGVQIGQLTSNAVNYLNSLRPSRDKNAPLDPTHKMSPVQKAAYDRALNMAEQPLLALKHVKDGTLIPQDVVALKTMYPSLYSRFAEKLTHQMIEQVNQGQLVPYKTRQALSLFLGQPLDSTMTPQAIIAAQPKPTLEPGANQPASKPKHSMNSLNKLPQQYQTATQMRQAARTSNKA